MAMTTEQIQLVRRSWKLFHGMDKALVGDAFYSKLFAEHPQLRKMFPKDMNQQYQKLVDMLNAIVSRLDRSAEIKLEIEAMGYRHLGYGVKPVHYKFVGEALLWTLQQGLGTDWTPAVEKAWLACYQELASAMIATAQGQPAHGA
jgi:hemoglobin-like flavoprotein